MALDGVLLNCILKELTDTVLGGRINKIHQPEKDEILLVIRTKAGDHRLLVSASPNYPRIHFSDIGKTNPKSPPVFCMVLRKHLLGGRILAIEQPSFERILVISIEARDELGILSQKSLIVETMGRHSNIILVNNQNCIIDSIKHISEKISRVRQVLPGLKYNFPPSRDRKNPLTQDTHALGEILSMPIDPAKAAKTLQNNFNGISMVTAKEIVHGAGIHNSIGENQPPLDNKKIINSFIDFFERIKRQDFLPTILKNEVGHVVDIFPFPYSQFTGELQESVDSISVGLDTFYKKRDGVDRWRQQSSHLLKLLNNNLDRAINKHGVLFEEYKDAVNADEYKLIGELITANLYQIPTGSERIELPNYYHPKGEAIEILLDKNKTPAKNAQNYYNKYNKAKNALIMIERQLKETETEIRYLETQLDNLGKCTEETEFKEIQQELVQEGYIKSRSRIKSSKPLPPSKPHHFISSDGFDIYVGKNNVQNDRLTFKTSGIRDLWLHAKGIPGSHVIVRSGNKEIPENTLMEAGMLAAFFSKGKNSANVAVDYCPRKNVRKPKGAKPGMVIYDGYNTMSITPDEDIINGLKQI